MAKREKQMGTENKEKNKKSKKKTVITVAIILIIVMVGAILAKNMLMPKGLPVETEPVTRMDLRETVEVRGVISGTDTADVYSKSSNRIAEILVKEGDRVKAGDKLARLEGDSSAVLYQKAELALEEAKREFENNEKLYQSGAISEEAYLKVKKAFKDAELSLKEINTEDDAFVTSPIDGTVTRVYTSVGKLAGGSQASSLFLVENIDQLQMVLRVSEYEINKVEVGQPVEITSSVIGDKIVNGKVTSIAPTGEQKTQGSAEMVVPVTVVLDDDHEGLFAGVNAKATIITKEAKGVLAVPVESVVEDADTYEQYVWIVNEGLLEKRTIKVLLEGDFYTGVEDNGAVMEGEEVVTSPDYDMTEGMQVQATSTADGDGTDKAE